MRSVRWWSRAGLVRQLILVICVLTVLYCLLSTTNNVNHSPPLSLSVRLSRPSESNAALVSSTSSAGQSPRTDVKSQPDQYVHYSARLSVTDVAKDALGDEMKFLRRRRQSDEEATLDSERAYMPAYLSATGTTSSLYQGGRGGRGGGGGGGSGLTSLSTSVADNQRLPVPPLGDGRPSRLSQSTADHPRTGRRQRDREAREILLTATTTNRQRQQQPAVTDEQTAADRLDLKSVITSFNLSLSDLPSVYSHTARRHEISVDIPSVLHQTSDDVNVPIQVGLLTAVLYVPVLGPKI